MKRFTIDGGEELEQRLHQFCERVGQEVVELIGAPRLEALVLGGGYGRGQGGVLRDQRGEQPYNDLEFYVFLKGSRLLNERRFRRVLECLGERLSPELGVHVEFKIESLRRLRRARVSMFSYDLVARHHLLLGNRTTFARCGQHLNAEEIPCEEATRLLLNRCSGLLFAAQLLRRDLLHPPDKDFVFRNIAKAELALGDAVLTRFGQYHWSGLERDRRLMRLKVASLGGPVSCWKSLRTHHASGLEFKLHPRCEDWPLPRLEQLHSEVLALACTVWLWLEQWRLGRSWTSMEQYAFELNRKCHGSFWGRNFLLNLQTFGVRGLRWPLAARYPRERLFNALPLLLWAEVGLSRTDILHFLQAQLDSDACDWTGLVDAYKTLWRRYG